MTEAGIIVVMLVLAIILGVCLVLAWIDYLFGNNKNEDYD